MPAIMSRYENHYSSSEATDTEGETDFDVTEEKFEEYAPQKEAVIVFLDVDSFEVQVRGLNEGYSPEVLKEEPFVTINEFGVITAVNYPAKEFGIKRAKEFTLEIARELCPALKILKIPNHYGKPDALSLRRASDEIYESLENSLIRHSEGRPIPKIEKASKDEFYIDVTDEVFHRVHRQQLQVPTAKQVNALKQERCFLEAPSYQATADKLSYRTLQVLTNPSIIQDRHVTEALLMHGAAIAHAILKDIRDDTQFTISAGVSSNKLLSKLGCGYHKPNSITVLPQSSLGRVSKKIEIKDIPGLGGKLGKKLVDKLRIESMSELGHKDRKFLQRVMGGEQALKFHQMAIGYDPSKVMAKKFCNSLTCGITFSYKTRRMAKPEHFYQNLRNRFLEMRDHLIYECTNHGPVRIPKSLRLEIKTRKGNLKVAFGETVEVDRDLRNTIARDVAMHNRNDSVLGGYELPSAWLTLYQYFLEQVEEECKINVIDPVVSAACAAIRKVSEINLIANFTPMAEDDD